MESIKFRIVRAPIIIQLMTGAARGRARARGQLPPCPPLEPPWFSAIYHLR